MGVFAIIYVFSYSLWNIWLGLNYICILTLFFIYFVHCNYIFIIYLNTLKNERGKLCCVQGYYAISLLNLSCNIKWLLVDFSLYSTREILIHEVYGGNPAYHNSAPDSLVVRIRHLLIGISPNRVTPLSTVLFGRRVAVVMPVWPLGQLAWASSPIKQKLT